MNSENTCRKCNGEGKVANSDEQEPWSAWANLPLRSATAVILGVIRPIDCPACEGRGYIPKATP